MALGIEQGKGLRSTGQLSEGLADGVTFERSPRMWGSEVCVCLKEDCSRHRVQDTRQELTWLSYYPSQNPLLPWCGSCPFLFSYMFSCSPLSRTYYVMLYCPCVCLFPLLGCGFLEGRDLMLHSGVLPLISTSICYEHVGKVIDSFRINSIDLSLCEARYFFSGILGHIFSERQLWSVLNFSGLQISICFDD